MENEIHNLLEEMRKKKINPQLVFAISNVILKYVKTVESIDTPDPQKKIVLSHDHATEIDRQQILEYPKGKPWADKIIFVLKILKFATAQEIRMMIMVFEQKKDSRLIHKNVELELSKKYLRNSPKSDKQEFFRKKILKKKEYLYCLSYYKHKDFWNSLGINDNSKVFDEEDFRLQAGF